MNSSRLQEIELIRSAYEAFNKRNIDAALTLMTTDVTWPKAFKGGFAQGPEGIRAYWTEQWSEINPHVEPVSFHLKESGRILVGVHLIVTDLAGVVLANTHLGHQFTLTQGLIHAMEVVSFPVGSLHSSESNLSEDNSNKDKAES